MNNLKLQIKGWQGMGRYCAIRRATRIFALAAALAGAGYAVAAALTWKQNAEVAVADRDIMLAMMNGQPGIVKHEDGSADFVHVETSVTHIERIE